MDKVNYLKAKALLSAMLNETVSIWTGVSKSRHDFETSICVCGKLEGKNDGDHYRVVFNDGCYSYFDIEHILEIITHPSQFKDGAIAVIKITVPNPPVVCADNDYYLNLTK